MPRKASPPPVEVADDITEIKHFCDETHTSILALATHAGVAQSALARFVAGERKSTTRSARRVLEFIRSRHNWHNRHSAILADTDAFDAEGVRIINAAITQLWDGQRDSAEIIAALMLALRPAIELSVGSKSSGQTRK